MKIRYFTLPNILTLCNLLCGCAAITYTLWYASPKTAFWFVVLAAIFDFTDGLAARLTGQYSELGKQLDSLADVVSFGVAPSAMLFFMCLEQGGGDLSFVMFIVAALGALRLARFNIDETQGDEFTGLPIPACGLFFASAVWLFADNVYFIQPVWMAVVVVVVAWLMISPIRMFSLKFHGYSPKDRNNLMRYAFVLLSLCALIVFRIKALPFIIIGYVAVSVVRNMVCKK